MGFLNTADLRIRADRHVAIKVLSAHASSEVESGRLRELDLLRKVTNASPLHHGSGHVVQLFHEFSFDSFAGRHICFVMDVLSYSISSLRSQLNNQRFPLRFILRIAKDVLKGLDYLHNECQIVHSGVSAFLFPISTGRCNYLTDLKPGNILLLPSDLDKIVTSEVLQHPGTLYTFPKTIPPEELPFHPVLSAPLIFSLDKTRNTELHWVITDLGHGKLMQHLGKLLMLNVLQLTPKENTLAKLCSRTLYVHLRLFSVLSGVLPSIYGASVVWYYCLFRCYSL